jgi:hypothetical protein
MTRAATACRCLLLFALLFSVRPLWAAPPAAKVAPLGSATVAAEQWQKSTPAPARNQPQETHLAWQEEPGQSYLVRGAFRLPDAKSYVRLVVAEKSWNDEAGKPRRASALDLRFVANATDGVELRIGRSTVAIPLAGPRAETWAPFVLYRLRQQVYLSVAGEAIPVATAPDESRGVLLVTALGAELREVQSTVLGALSADQVPLVLEGATNARLGGPGADLRGGLQLDPAALPVGAQQVDGVPFLFPLEPVGCDVAPSMAGIKGQIRGKSVYHNPALRHANGRLVFALPPEAPYRALHLVAFARQYDDAVPRLTVRAGIAGWSGIFADQVVQVPLVTAGEGPEVLSRLPIKLADGSAGYLYRLRVPLASTGHLWESPNAVRDLEFTRDLQVHVNLPDPNEFTLIPAGPPSGVVIVAATLERSPVVVTQETIEPGNIFHETQTPQFRLKLSNRSAAELTARVTATCSGPGTGENSLLPLAEFTRQTEVKLAPGADGVATLDVTPPTKLRGWYRCVLDVQVGGEAVQTRTTSFAVLAPNTRQATTESPFGVWAFFGVHNAIGREDLRDYLGSILQKGGWRWTYGGSPSGTRQATAEDFQVMSTKWGVRHNVQSPPEGYQRGEGWYKPEELAKSLPGFLQSATDRNFDRSFKVMHESRSSTSLLRRFSEFMGGEHYDMPADEKAKLDKQYENVVAYCRALKAADPTCRIVLINDYPGVGVEFMRRGIPKEVFDVFGSEGANFLREPERQPDWLSLHAIQQQWHRARKQYGYEDKPVWYTEALYHGTNPGNLTLHDQAVYYAREAMLALANGVERMAAMGCEKDSSDDYRWSHWGEVGYLYRTPECNPKPSFAMFAWLTQVLDQAKYAGYLQGPSTVVHVLDFARPDGAHIYPLWVVRGRQQVTLAATGTPVVYDAFGNVIPATLRDGALELTVTPAPLYVTGATVTGVTVCRAEEVTRPLGQPLLTFAQAGAVQPIAERSAVLESSWDYPRVQGKFELTTAKVDGTDTLRLALQPDADERKLLQRYVELRLAQPLPLAGRPTAFSVRLKGNGGWGRIMFELTDAKGRVWTSCGNQYEGSSNSSDNRGASYVSFDGWHTLHIPIVGQHASSDQQVFLPDNHCWWVTNNPELDELKAQYEKAKAEFPAKQEAYAKAKAEHDAVVKTYNDAVAAGQKNLKKPGSAPVAPKLAEPRNYGIAPVDYPLTLTKVIVAMPPSIIYVNREIPVAEPVLYLDRLGVLDTPAGSALVR